MHDSKEDCDVEVLAANRASLRAQQARYTGWLAGRAGSVSCVCPESLARRAAPLPCSHLTPDHPRTLDTLTLTPTLVPSLTLTLPARTPVPPQTTRQPPHVPTPCTTHRTSFLRHLQPAPHAHTHTLPHSLTHSLDHIHLPINHPSHPLAYFIPQTTLSPDTTASTHAATPPFTRTQHTPIVSIPLLSLPP